MVEMTDKGERFRQDVEAIYREVESSWAERMGQGELEHMRERLTAFLMDMNGGTLPPPAPRLARRSTL